MKLTQITLIGLFIACVVLLAFSVSGAPATVSSDIPTTSGGSGSFLMVAYSDTTATPSTVVGETQSSGSSAYGSITFCVLAGSYYKVNITSGSATLQYWTEWN